MPPARHSIGWTHASPHSFILPWAVAGFPVGYRRGTPEAKLKRGTWLCFSATISTSQIVFPWKSQLSLVAPGMNPGLSAVPGMGRGERPLCLMPLVQPCQTSSTVKPWPGCAWGRQLDLQLENNLVCPERRRSFPGGLGTISCLQGDTKHLPAAQGSPGWRRGAEGPGQDSPWELRQQRREPGQRRGSCVTDAGLWQGAEEVLQQH